MGADWNQVEGRFYVDFRQQFKAPAPSRVTISATRSTVVYEREQSSGSIPSFTDRPGGNDRLVMRCHFPGGLWG